MKDDEITKILVSFNGQIEYVTFPAGVFDDLLYVQYEAVWGPDWEPISGLTSSTSQMARSGSDPESVTFNMPVDIVFSTTNISGWPQLVLTVRAQNPISGDSLRGYGLVLCPPTAGPRSITAPLVRPCASTVLGEWLSWITGRYPELVDPKMLANGKDNYLLRTESYGAVQLRLNMLSKDMRRLGFDNQQAQINKPGLDGSRLCVTGRVVSAEGTRPEFLERLAQGYFYKKKLSNFYRYENTL